MYPLYVCALYKPGTKIIIDDDELIVDWIEILEDNIFYHFKSNNPDQHLRMRADYLDERIKESISSIR